MILSADIVAECKKIFEAFKADSSSLLSDISFPVLATIVKNGGESKQQIIIDQYLKSSLVAEKNSYLLVLVLAPKEEFFEQTPKMSTYIVAFVVGEFDFIESTKEGIRVYKCVGNKESSEFALDITTKALYYFIDYFGIPFPLNKCDHIAILFKI
ncbi:hypothetical protein ACTFIY_000497 [Dictyostelium cf. discoideum]